MKRVIVLFFVAVAAMFGEEVSLEARSLRGIRVVKVLVENLSSDAKDAGLLESEIQTDVELRLRLAGITVVTSADNLFYVKASIWRVKDVERQMYYGLACRMEQVVTLVRDPTIITMATTWHTEQVGLVPTRLVQNIRNEVKDQVDSFLNDYLSVNPKK